MSVSKNIAKRIEKKKPIVKVSSPDNELAKYLAGSPSRKEVADYVDSIMTNYYLPMIADRVQLSATILQAILLEKQVCTSEEIKAVSVEFIREHKYRIMAMKDREAVTAFLVKTAAIPDDNPIENGLCLRLTALIKLVIPENEYAIESEDAKQIIDVCDQCLSALTAINTGDSNTITDKQMKSIALKALSLRNHLEHSGWEFIVSTETPELLMKGSVLHVLTEIIARCMAGVQQVEE